MTPWGVDGGLQPQKDRVRHPLWVLNELWDFTFPFRRAQQTLFTQSSVPPLLMPTAHYYRDTSRLAV